MKTDNTHTKNLTELLRRIKRKTKPDKAEQLEPIAQLVLSFLQWNSTHRAADTAHGRLMEQMVDNNDLRVSYDSEIVTLIGKDYPWAHERVARMREALNEIFNREHTVTLDHLARKPKKDVRIYLETLPGMPPYVVAQVLLLCFGGHAVPVDNKLAALLGDEQIVPPGSTPHEISPFLERHIKAAEAVNAHLALQAWADSTRRKIDATAEGAGMAEFVEMIARESGKQTSQRTNKKVAKKILKKKK